MSSEPLWSLQDWVQVVADIEKEERDRLREDAVNSDLCCAWRGYHVKEGASNGDVTLWFDQCQDCGADLSPPEQRARWHR